MEIKDIGRISDGLIYFLDERFPDKAPSGKETLEEIHQQIGAVQAVRTIKEWKAHIENPRDYDHVYT